MDERREDTDFEQRLTAAQERASRQPGTGTTHESVGSGQRAVNLAMRLGVELVAAMIVAVAIGWELDRLFHTKPWLMVVMVPVGMAAGLRNLVRSAGVER